MRTHPVTDILTWGRPVMFRGSSFIVSTMEGGTTPFFVERRTRGEDLFGELPDVEELPGPQRGMLAGVELEGRGNMVVLDDDEESGTRDVTTMMEKPDIKDIER